MEKLKQFSFFAFEGEFFSIRKWWKDRKKGNMMKSNTVECYVVKRPPLDFAVLEDIFL